MEMEDLALSGQKVIENAETLHGLQMSEQYCCRNYLPDLSRLVSTFFERVERLQSNLLVSRILLVALRNTCIEIPAVIVERLGRSLALLNKSPNIFQRPVFEMLESNYNIGHLNPSIVDVILHIDVIVGRSQKANKRVAQNGVAQMPNMRGFIGIDAGVLHQHLLLRALLRLRTAIAHERFKIAWPVQPGIDVAGPGDFQTFKSGNLAQACNEFLGTFPWGLAQLLSKFECNWKSIFAELYFRWLIDDDVLRLYRVIHPQEFAK